MHKQLNKENYKRS